MFRFKKTGELVITDPALHKRLHRFLSEHRKRKLKLSLKAKTRRGRNGGKVVPDSMCPCSATLTPKKTR